MDAHGLDDRPGSNLCHRRFNAQDPLGPNRAWEVTKDKIGQETVSHRAIYYVNSMYIYIIILLFADIDDIAFPFAVWLTTLWNGQSDSAAELALLVQFGF